MCRLFVCSERLHSSLSLLYDGGRGGGGGGPPSSSRRQPLSLSLSPSPPLCLRCQVANEDSISLRCGAGGASTSLSPSSSSFLPSPKRPFRSCVSIALVARRPPGHLAPVTRPRSPKWSWRVDGEKYKANIGSVTMDGPIGTEAIRRSFWNQREGQSISPAHGGAIFLCHKRCMAMLSETFLPLFKWPARFTNNCVIPYLFPLISCLFPHLPLQEVSPIDKTSECSIFIAPLLVRPQNF